MKDLKHLLYFESLLQDAGNELIDEAHSKGGVCAAYVCENTPEPLLNLGNAFSIRLRAPRTSSMEMGTYYMTSLLCECCRALLERALEGGYQFLDCIIAPDACAQMNRCVENVERLKLCDKEKFFVSYADVPMKSDETALRHYVRQMRLRALDPLRDTFGVDTSDEALREAVRTHNEVCRLITAIGEHRMEDRPRITGTEFHVLCTATYCCPKDLLVDRLRETLEELGSREPDAAGKYRARVVMVGSELDSPDLIRLTEEAGALVVADRFCFGSFPGRQEIALDGSEDVLTQICRQYLAWGQCPRFMDTAKIGVRHDYVDALAKRFRADGVVYQQMKFCDYWGYERALASRVMREDFGYPVLSVDVPYVVGASAQLRTRVQAFVESVEIKKIRGEAVL